MDLSWKTFLILEVLPRLKTYEDGIGRGGGKAGPIKHLATLDASSYGIRITVYVKHGAGFIKRK